MSRKSAKLQRLASQVEPGPDLQVERDREFVAVVAKAFELLSAFDGAQARLRNQEMAAITGMPKATVARLTYTLTRLGYLTYLPNDCAYKLGDRAIALSGSILRGLDFRFSIRPYMKELADFASATCAMGIQDGNSILYLEHCRCDLPVTLHHSFGSRVPLFTSAAGRSYVCAISSEARERLFRDVERAPPPGWAGIKENVVAAVEGYRATGYVTVCGEWMDHINGVATAVLSPRHATWFTFNCGGLASILTPDRIHRDIAPRLLDMARRITEILVASQDSSLLPVSNLYLRG